MKKPLLVFSITFFLLLFLQTKAVFAQQSCGCTRSGFQYNIDTKTTDRWCMPDPNNNLCSAPNPVCRCDDIDTCNTSDPTCTQNKPCPSGECVQQPATATCEGNPSHYCTTNCGLLNRLPAMDSTCAQGKVCCRIDPSTTGNTGDCCSLSSNPNRRTCNSLCLWGVDIGGLTCQEKTWTSGPQATNNCSCTCTSPQVGPGQPLPSLNVWGSCGVNVGIDTAIGCIPIDPSSLVQTFISLIISLAGVIAFLMMIFASIQIILAGGNPEKLQAGKEMLTSAIIGLILIIFSTVILELIGVHILQIPGFLTFQ
jgi:hypothetical protein